MGTLSQRKWVIKQGLYGDKHELKGTILTEQKNKEREVKNEDEDAFPGGPSLLREQECDFSAFPVWPRNSETTSYTEAK